MRAEYKDKTFLVPDDLARLEHAIPESGADGYPTGSLIKFNGVKFVGCAFDKLDLKRDLLVSFYNCVFDRCTFRHTRMYRLQYCEFLTCDFRESDFGGADIIGSRTLNCRCDRAKFHGVTMRLECHFFDGLVSEREADGWKLAWFASLPKTPAQTAIRDAIPADVRLCLEKTFERD